jgi:hypothetical protein
MLNHFSLFYDIKILQVNDDLTCYVSNEKLLPERQLINGPQKTNVCFNRRNSVRDRRVGSGSKKCGSDNLSLTVSTNYNLVFYKITFKLPEKYTRCASLQTNNRIKASRIFRPTLSFRLKKSIERIQSPGPGPKNFDPTISKCSALNISWFVRSYSICNFR